MDRPLRKARDRASASGVSVTWIRGDVTKLQAAGLQPGFSLFFDRGCFHGLNEGQRALYASGVTELAAPGATLLLMAFAPNNVLVAPTGVDEAEVARTFAGWELTSSAADSGPAPAGPMRDVLRRWYRLRRRA